jgi:addiction module RelB/DinJ family antitoxin
MNTVISLRIDKSVKKSAQEVADSMGIKLGTLINALLRQVVATRRIELYAPEVMTPKLERLISQVQQVVKSGKISKTHTTVKDFITELKS